MKVFTLKQLNLSIRRMIEGIGQDFWIRAEVAQTNIQQHVYLEFVQKEDEELVAKARAVLWAGQRFALEGKLGKLLYDLLQIGTKVQVQVRVTYHEVHGLSLVVLDLDPAYTLGELEQRRLDTIAKLEAEGLLEQQKKLVFPLVPQRVAIISSPNAAGLSDFEDQLRHNEYGFVFHAQLFPASVQGEKAVGEIVAQLQAVPATDFDVVVLLRGGGSRLDLECFNDYVLSRAVAQCPLPIIAGIGHHRDQTVGDLVAFVSVKTPTAAAEYLVRHCMVFESRLKELLDVVMQGAERKTEKQKGRLQELFYGLQQAAQVPLNRERQTLDRMAWQLENQASNLIERNMQQVLFLKKQLISLDPENVLKRGYSLTFKDGKPIKNGERVGIGDTIQTITSHLTFESQVTKKTERNG